MFGNFLSSKIHQLRGGLEVERGPYENKDEMMTSYFNVLKNESITWTELGYLMLTLINIKKIHMG